MKNTRITLLAAIIVLTSITASAATMVWSGAGPSPFWRLAANWVGGVVPDSLDSAVFDATTKKSCIIDSSITVGSITMKPAFTGNITFKAPFTIKTSFTVRDTVTIQYNLHEYSHIKGTLVDLSGVKYVIGGLAECSFDLDADAGAVQVLIPPSDTSVRIPQLRSYGFGTVSLQGYMKVDIFDVSGGQTFNWNGHGGRFGVFGYGAQTTGLGGADITVWSYVSWSPNGFWKSKNYDYRTNTAPINLAPATPWKFTVIRGGTLQIWSDPAFVPNNKMITNAIVGNCDASGGITIDAITSTNAGGNKNVTFNGQAVIIRQPLRSAGGIHAVSSSGASHRYNLLGRNASAVNSRHGVTLQRIVNR